MRLYLLLVVAALLGEGFGFWLAYEAKARPALELVDGLRAQVAALRAADGDGSCAVGHDGLRVLCALRGDRLQRTTLADGDVICGAVLKNQNRVECALADGQRVTLRREAARRRP